MPSPSTFTLPPHFNFAKRSGMISVPAASVFALIYLPLLFWFLFLGMRNPTYVYATLSMFCFLRIPSFAIRAALAGNWHRAAEKLGLVVADQVLFGVGFFGLLYSAYILVLDRELATGHAPPPGHISYKFRRNRPLFRVLLSAAVLISIVGASMTTPTRSVATDNTLLALRQASTSIFFVLTVLQTALMIRLGYAELRDRANRTSHITTSANFGSRHTLILLIAITVLLLVRQTFAMVTVNKSVTQNKERYWYPLITVPEFLAVLLYAIPGLVPPRMNSGDCSKQLDTESHPSSSQSSSSQSSSQLSASLSNTGLEDAKPDRRGSDETEVEKAASMLEKRRGSKCDSRSDVDTVVMVSSEQDSICEKEEGQLANSTTFVEEGSQREDEQNVILPRSSGNSDSV